MPDGAPAPATAAAAAAPAPAPASAPAPVSAAKRKYSEVLGTFATQEDRDGAKRGKFSAFFCSDTKSSKEQLQFAGKYLARAINPYLDVGLVMTYGAARNWNPPSAPDPSNSIAVPQWELEVQKTHADAFNAMFASAPGCLDVVKEFYQDSDKTHWSSLVSLIRSSARSARQQDTNKLKQHPHYVLPDPNSDTLSPPVSRGTSKSDRGITYPVLCNYIISWTLRNEINETEISNSSSDTDSSDDTNAQGPKLTTNATEALRMLLHHEIDVDAEEFPSFCWADGTYDADDIAKGLLRGPLVPRILRHLWTAPASALSRATKIPTRCNARAHGTFKIVPEMIAYGVVQGRTMLSTADWDVLDGHFNYEDFFNAIIELFKDPEGGTWAEETLAWYQEQVFGAPSPSITGSVRPVKNATAAIKAQRAKRAAATSTAST
ncbi:hypothetical protein B0H16DRAFT_1484738 [Mycena metata]|uniref:Uncharacterized protein n=1 Tax=Mycena metata TaxID=1033252 RepID=A0AAD7GNL7_9AGAR|nr:hypothetical protein B0H16DRAFT_1484738 [Mycena metata]